MILKSSLTGCNGSLPACIGSKKYFSNNMQPEKIAIVGAASVGKTTITSACREAYASNPAVSVLDEGAEHFFAGRNGLPLSELHSFPVQSALQDYVVSRERDAVAPGVRLLITDRSALDPAVYLRFAGDAEGSDLLLKRVASWIPTYSMFLLPNPADVPYEHGTHRVENDHERFKIHSMFTQLFDKNKLPYAVVSGTRERRMQTVHSVIQSLLTNG